MDGKEAYAALMRKQALRSENPTFRTIWDTSMHFPTQTDKRKSHERKSPIFFLHGRGSSYNIEPRDADMAQLVEHHLAKVGVAGSNPVVRSIDDTGRSMCWPASFIIGLFGATWPSGKAEACKAFTPGSNPGVASKLSTTVPHPPDFSRG